MSANAYVDNSGSKLNGRFNDLIRQLLHYISLNPFAALAP